MEKQAKISAADLAKFCGSCMKEKFAENVIVLPLSNDNSIADYLVIGTADSEPQINALVGFVERQARDLYQLRPLSENGSSASGWVIIDFVTVIVHIMTSDARDRYNLEALWGENGDTALARLNAARNPENA